MFTCNKIKLSEFSRILNLQIHRDCDFSYVGKIGTSLENRIVPCNSKNHILESISKSGIVGVITTHDLINLVPENIGLASSDNPIKTTLELHELISCMPDLQWKKFKSIIHPSVKIGSGAYVSEEDVKIGENSIIHPNATILPRSIIESNVMIGSGTVIGSDAFEVNKSANPRKILKQSGGVKIGKNVEILSNCTITRATFGGFTEIGDDCKIDCKVHVAHDCIIYEKVIIAACAEISGRVNIGSNSFIGPNVSITNGCTIGKDAHITIGSVVTTNVQDCARVSGNFAVEHNKWLQFIRAIR